MSQPDLDLDLDLGLDLDLDLDLGGARRGSSDGGTADDGHHGAVLVRPCAAFTQLCTVRL